MKRVGELYDEIVTWDNIRLGYYKAARGKRTKHAVLAFRRDLDANLATIRRTLLDPNHPGIGRYRFFTIHDPKERRICEAPFADRVLHHAIMSPSRSTTATPAAPARGPMRRYVVHCIAHDATPGSPNATSVTTSIRSTTMF